MHRSLSSAHIPFYSGKLAHLQVVLNCRYSVLFGQVSTKLMGKSINGPYRFEQLIGKFLSRLDKDDMIHAIWNDKNDKKNKEFNDLKAFLR